MAKGRKNIEFAEILRLIEESRNKAFQKVNEELVLLYFGVGRIVSEKVAAGFWGNNTVDELAAYINSQYQRLTGFNRRGLYRMKQFYETYSSSGFVSALLTQLQVNENEHAIFVTPLVTQFKEVNNTSLKEVTSLLSKISWTHHLLILAKTKTIKERLYYLTACINDKLSKRELERQLNSAVFERTALANNKVSSAVTQIRQDLFKDLYIFEFLDLPERHSEKDLEKALMHNLQKFILEIGKGFTYMGNQYRLQVGKKDYYTDLLFYHRDLQCLVLFELKIQEFEPEFLGKLNFYLEILDQNIKRPHENPSIGVLICKEKDNEVVKYSMARTTSPAIIAEYETKLIPRKVLANKLHQLIEQLSIQHEPGTDQ